MYLVRPAREGLLIPVPQTGVDLAAAGEILPVVDLYWMRRQADGDVTIDVVAAETVEAAIAEIAARPAAAEMVATDEPVAAETDTSAEPKKRKG